MSDLTAPVRVGNHWNSVRCLFAAVPSGAVRETSIGLIADTDSLPYFGRFGRRHFKLLSSQRNHQRQISPRSRPPSLFSPKALRLLLDHSLLLHAGILFHPHIQAIEVPGSTIWV